MKQLLKDKISISKREFQEMKQIAGKPFYDGFFVGMVTASIVCVFTLGIFAAFGGM